MGGRRHVVRNEPDAGVWGRSLGCGASVVGLELGWVWRVSEERRDLEHSARRKSAVGLCDVRSLIQALARCLPFLRTTRVMPSKCNELASGMIPVMRRGPLWGSISAGAPRAKGCVVLH